MKVSAIKTLVEPLELDSEVKQKIFALMASFGDDDELPLETKNQVLELLDLEIETNELLAQTYDQMTQEIDKYHAEVGQAITDNKTLTTKQ